MTCRLQLFIVDKELFCLTFTVIFLITMLLAYSNLIEVDFIYCHILPFIDACIRYLTVFLTVYYLKGRVQQLLQQFSRRKESRGSVSYVQNYFHNIETFTWG